MTVTCAAVPKLISQMESKVQLQPGRLVEAHLANMHFESVHRSLGCNE
jgi:hypothetical protein